MPMTLFMARFPEVGPRETKSAEVMEPGALPVGEYGFFEFYCDELDCDCRRVTISVLRPENGWSKIWATIGYGWESADFYRKWSGGSSDPIETQVPGLDPLHPQTHYSVALLDLFRYLLESPEYVDRLKQHYRMFRASVKQEILENKRQENKLKRLRDPRRRRHAH
jgi:hypothetical protein